MSASPSTPVRSKLSRLLLGLLIGAAAIYLAARELSWTAVVEAFTTVRPGWLAVGVAIAFADQTIKAVRWRLMLAAEPDPPDFRTAWIFHLSGQLGNIMVPGPAGDVGRILVVGGRGQGRMFTLGTVALEKVVDLVAFGLLVAVLLVQAPLPEWVAGSATGLAAAALLAVIGLWLAVRYRARLAPAADRLLERLPGSWGQRAKSGVRAAAAALNAVDGRGAAIRLVTTTALIWAGSVLVNHALFLAFDLSLPLGASALLLVVLQAGVSTNLVPGTVGLFELLVVETLALYGVPRQVAFSLGILLHVVVLVPLATAAFVGTLGGFWEDRRMGHG